MTVYQAEVMADGFWRVGQVARFLGVHRSTVYDMMSRTELPYTIIGKRRKVPVRFVRELAAERLTATK